jgi:hypothetical protein
MYKKGPHITEMCFSYQSIQLFELFDYDLVLKQFIL